MTKDKNNYDQLDAWIEAHFSEQVEFLTELVKVPTDTPPGNNAPHAERTAKLLEHYGMNARRFQYQPTLLKKLDWSQLQILSFVESTQMDQP